MTGHLQDPLATALALRERADGLRANATAHEEAERLEEASRTLGDEATALRTLARALREAALAAEQRAQEADNAAWAVLEGAA